MLCLWNQRMIIGFLFIIINSVSETLRSIPKHLSVFQVFVRYVLFNLRGSLRTDSCLFFFIWWRNVFLSRIDNVLSLFQSLLFNGFYCNRKPVKYEINFSLDFLNLMDENYNFDWLGIKKKLFWTEVWKRVLGIVQLKHPFCSDIKFNGNQYFQLNWIL